MNRAHKWLKTARS